jgi:hypothetical protein
MFPKRALSFVVTGISTDFEADANIVQSLAYYGFRSSTKYILLIKSTVFAICCELSAYFLLHVLEIENKVKRRKCLSKYCKISIKTGVIKKERRI